MMVLNERIKFLMGEFWMLSIQGAFSHVSIYKTKNDDQRIKFKKSLKNYINICILPYYLNSETVSDTRHITNIVYISCGARKYKKIVRNFSIGVAQKLLNLYLKYLWCAGLIGMPPHCPFDSNVINKLKEMDFISNQIAWTKMNLKDYIKLVDAAKKAALEKGVSIAVWELETFNNKRKT